MKRTLWVAFAVALAVTIPASAEKLLVRGEDEYLGRQKDSKTFETCNGSSITLMEGDVVKETDEKCHDDEVVGPNLEEDEHDEEPPPA